MSHHVTALRSGREERTTPRHTARIVCAHAAVLLLLASVLLAEQFAPVPPHEQRHSPTIESDIVARVNGTPIRAAELDAALNTGESDLNVTPEKLAEMRAQALDRLIDEELRYEEGVRLKIEVPEAALEQALERARRDSGATRPQQRASVARALIIRKVDERVVGAACRGTEADAQTRCTEAALAWAKRLRAAARVEIIRDQGVLGESTR